MGNKNGKIKRIKEKEREEVNIYSELNMLNKKVDSKYYIIFIFFFLF